MFLVLLPRKSNILGLAGLYRGLDYALCEPGSTLAGEIAKSEVGADLKSSELVWLENVLKQLLC